ncbi:MAG: hypothetical protein REH83_02785 [Rickettsiella sp.]|nr:hypothetical protein [Rickettsiella sp.]
MDIGFGVFEEAKYQSWSKKFSASQKSVSDLKLIGAHFNAHQTIYLLCCSMAKKALYLASFNIVNHEINKIIKHVATIPEEFIYNASVYEENAEFIRWYLLGKKTIWCLSLKKQENFSAVMEPYATHLYPLDLLNPYRDHEGGSLIVFDKQPWVIGGKLNKDNGVDTRSRVLLGSRWGDWMLGRPGTGNNWVGEARNNFLIQPRVSPIVHIKDEKIICIGGNTVDPENIVEFFYIRPYYNIPRHPQAREDETTKIYNTERSIQSYVGLNAGIKTYSPFPASCVFENCIFIFSDQLFNNENPMYYKYNFSSGRSSGGGSGDWEFLVPAEYKPQDLIFSSSKAITVGRSIYLILFRSHKATDSEEYLEDEVTLCRCQESKITIYEIS